MTNTLKWRLGKFPTPDEVLRLLNEKLITKEEARDILFNQETEEDIKKADLEQEIKFLRDVVQKLSSNKTKIVEVIREVQKPYYQWGWYQPYTVWCGTTGGASGSLLTTTGDSTYTYATALGSTAQTAGLASSSISGSNAVNAFYTSTSDAPSNFSDIKTF